jgi:hypothetical protein
MYAPENSSGLYLSQTQIKILLDSGGNYGLNQIGKAMPIADLIGKILFPRHNRGERRHKVKLFFVGVLIAFIVIALFVVVMIVLIGSVHIKLDDLLQ